MNQQTIFNEELGTQSVTWDLADLYDSIDSAQLKTDMEWCENQANSISEKFKDKVSTLSSRKLFTLVEKIENVHTLLGKISTYGFLNFTTQIDNEIAGAFFQQVRELISRCEKSIVFFELEWNLIEEKRASILLSSQELNKYKHYLFSLRRYRNHQLSEIEEKLLIELSPIGRSSWNTLFEKVFGNMRFGDDQRTEEEVLTDLYSADREVRKKATLDMTEGLRKHNHILTHIYNNQAADKMISDRLRRHESWADSMNLENQIQADTVDTLISTVVSRYDIVEKYYNFKRKLLGLDELTEYDRYAPLPNLPGQKTDWKTCKEIVLSSFAKFSDQLATTAEQFFTQNWIHAPIHHGKRGGAFAHPCVPDSHPFVMVNYTGSIRDISTVAHELGHGVHQCLAAKQGYFNSDTPLVLAETASVFAELLVFKAQLSLLQNDVEKRAFICQKLESIFATVFRQTAMNRFEALMHEGRRQKGELSSDQLSSYWLQTQKAMFGNSITMSDDYGLWWSYIPHFLFTPGYVYSYAFGELLVLALYSRYQDEGAPFVEKYLTLLSKGGSATPYELVAPFGIDLNDPNFWQSGLGLIDSMLSEITV